MKNEAYTAHLQEKYADKPDDLAAHVKALADFHAFLTENGVESEQSITREDAVRYVVQRREHDKDISETIGMLTDYAYFIRNMALISELVLLRDASHVMDRTSALIKEHAAEAWARIFGGVHIPEVGATLDEMSDFTRETEKRMFAAMPRADIERVLSKNAHGWEPEWHWDEHARLVEAGTLDKYLEAHHEGFIQELEGYRDRNEIFFTSEIDDAVIAFAREHLKPVRVGNKIVHIRAPYLMKQYLEAEDRDMKRYYACHCPWKRNAILQKEGALSHAWCYCCLGHAKKSFDFAFEQDIPGKVIQTMMDEDCVLCTYEYEIPEDIMAEFA